MTRSEAIGHLKNIAIYSFQDGYTDEARQALDMAIKALDQPEIIRCEDCKHRILNENYGKKGYIKIKAMCELDTGDPFELGRDADDDDWYCKDAERRVKE